MEKKVRHHVSVRPQVSAKLFSVARSDSPESKTGAGIVIQIRLKSPAAQPSGKLLTRKNTEFWLSAND